MYLKRIGGRDGVGVEGGGMGGGMGRGWRGQEDKRCKEKSTIENRADVVFKRYTSLDAATAE